MTRSEVHYETYNLTTTRTEVREERTSGGEWYEVERTTTTETREELVPAPMEFVYGGREQSDVS